MFGFDIFEEHIFNFQNYSSCYCNVRINVKFVLTGSWKMFFALDATQRCKREDTTL